MENGNLDKELNALEVPETKPGWIVVDGTALKIATIEADRNSWQELAELVEIKNIESVHDFINGAEVWQKLRQHRDDLDKAYTAVLHKLDIYIGQINELFKVSEDVQRLLKKKLGEWIDEATKEARLAQVQEEAAVKTKLQVERAEAVETLRGAGMIAEASALELEEIVLPPIPLRLDIPKIKDLRFRDNWTFKVVNIALVPKEYFKEPAIDSAKIRAEVNKLHEATAIPGIEVKKEKV